MSEWVKTSVSQIKLFWDGLGWLANAIEVILFLLLVLGGGRKIMKFTLARLKRNKFVSITDFVQTTVGDKYFIESNLKRNSHIAIVDDEPGDFPVEYLRRVGLDVNVFDKISLADVDRLSNYDVIFLDIVGVVEEDLARGGFELLKRIKSQPKPPTLIAVSGRKFDPTVTDFFKLADDVMRKPMKEVECEEEIYSLLESKKSPLNAAREIDVLLTESKLSSRDLSAVRSLILGAIEERKMDAGFVTHLRKKYGLEDAQRICDKSSIIVSWLESNG